MIFIYFWLVWYPHCTDFTVYTMLHLTFNNIDNVTCECFSDTMIEETGGRTVAEIFKLHGESFFRDNEVSKE